MLLFPLMLNICYHSPNGCPYSYFSYYTRTRSVHTVQKQIFTWNQVSAFNVKRSCSGTCKQTWTLAFQFSLSVKAFFVSYMLVITHFTFKSDNSLQVKTRYTVHISFPYMRQDRAWLYPLPSTWHLYIHDKFHTVIPARNIHFLYTISV